MHKLTLHGGFSCPNRDGTIGRGGCTFCNVASFADEAQQHRSIAQRLAHQANLVNRAKRYLAYFQAYTSTFAEVQVLRSMYQQAVSQANIVGLCVGTRRTACRMRCWICFANIRTRVTKCGWSWGYKPPTTKRCIASTAAMILPVISVNPDGTSARAEGVFHLIVGLPGEGQAECLQTLERVVETGVDGIKLHPLHIVKGSIMAKAWEAGRLNGIELEDYTLTAGEMIRHTPPEVIYHRISASARRPTLLAPLWCENRWTGMVELDRYLNEHGVQGSALERPWIPPTE